MQNITVGRYASKDVPWAGWLEPADKSWIMFIGRDGKPIVFLDRDETGAVVVPEAAD